VVSTGAIAYCTCELHFAAGGGARHHGIARPECGDARPDAVDHAGDVVAGNARGALPVHRIDAGGIHLDQHLPGAWQRRGHRLQREALAGLHDGL
jgi:hypothetical protein